MTGLNVIIGLFSSLAVNMPDFGRFSRDGLKGPHQFLALPIIGTLGALTPIFVTDAHSVLWGEFEWWVINSSSLPLQLLTVLLVGTCRPLLPNSTRAQRSSSLVRASCSQPSETKSQQAPIHFQTTSQEWRPSTSISSERPASSLSSASSLRPGTSSRMLKACSPSCPDIHALWVL